MKTNYLAKIAAAGIMTVAPLLSGCMSDGELAIKVLEIKHESRTAIATPKENMENVSKRIYEKETNVLNDNKVSQKTMDSFMQAYHNRK